MKSNIENATIFDCLISGATRLGQTVQTLAAGYIIDSKASPQQLLDPDGSDRNVALPAVRKGLGFAIYNRGTAGNLVVKSGVTVIAMIPPGAMQDLASDGVSWISGNPVLIRGTIGDWLIFLVADVPVDYTDGTPPATGEGVAGIGSLAIDYTHGKIYINGGTKAQPLWKLVTSA